MYEMLSKTILNFLNSNVTKLFKLNNLFEKLQRRVKIIKNKFIRIVSISEFENCLTNISNNLLKSRKIDN